MKICVLPPPLMRASVANVSKVSTAKHLSPPAAGKAAGELICEPCWAGEPLCLLFCPPVLASSLSARGNRQRLAPNPKGAEWGGDGRDSAGA